MQQIVESIPTTPFPLAPRGFIETTTTNPGTRTLTTPQQRAVEAAIADTAITKTTPQLLRDLIGAEVFYVLSDSQRRPAVVVRDWGNNMVNLQVFTDGLNDFAPGDPGCDGTLWATSVHYAPASSKTPGTWHWRTESI